MQLEQRHSILVDHQQVLGDTWLEECHQGIIGKHRDPTL
jgi:hypothetical protein